MNNINVKLHGTISFPVMFYTSSYLGTPHSSILPFFPSLIHLYSCPLPFFILPSPTGLLPIVLLFLMFLIFSSSACSSLIYSIFFLFTLPICLLCILFNFIVFFTILYLVLFLFLYFFVFLPFFCSLLVL